MPVIIGTLKTVGDYPAVNSENVKGGLHSVATVAGLDAITTAHREPGMLCYVTDSQKYYSLNNDLTTWSEFSGGLASPIELYTFECAEVIAKHQIVYVKNNGLIVADCKNLAGIHLLPGVALQAGVIGQTIEIVTRGLIIDPAWNWSSEVLFLGESGQFSTVRPDSPSVFWKVANVTSSSSIFFHLNFEPYRI